MDDDDYNRRGIPIKLTSLDNDNDHRHLFLTLGEPVTVGRASKSPDKPDWHASSTNARFNCPVVSRDHAELELKANLWAETPHQVYIKDLGSLHGTQLNGAHLHRHAPTVLQDGDEIVLGSRVVNGHVSHESVTLRFDRARLLPKTPSLSNDASSVTFRVPDPSDDDNGDYHSDSDLMSDAPSIIDQDDSDLHKEPSSAQTTPEQAKAEPGSEASPIDVETISSVIRKETIDPELAADDGLAASSSEIPIVIPFERPGRPKLPCTIPYWVPDPISAANEMQVFVPDSLPAVPNHALSKPFNDEDEKASEFSEDDELRALIDNASEDGDDESDVSFAPHVEEDRLSSNDSQRMSPSSEDSDSDNDVPAGEGSDAENNPPSDDRSDKGSDNDLPEESELEHEASDAASESERQPSPELGFQSPIKPASLSLPRLNSTPQQWWPNPHPAPAHFNNHASRWDVLPPPPGFPPPPPAFPTPGSMPNAYPGPYPQFPYQPPPVPGFTTSDLLQPMSNFPPMGAWSSGPHQTMPAAWDSGVKPAQKKASCDEQELESGRDYYYEREPAKSFVAVQLSRSAAQAYLRLRHAYDTLVPSCSESEISRELDMDSHTLSAALVKLRDLGVADCIVPDHSQWTLCNFKRWSDMHEYVRASAEELVGPVWTTNKRKRTADEMEDETEPFTPCERMVAAGAREAFSSNEPVDPADVPASLATFESLTTGPEQPLVGVAQPAQEKPTPPPAKKAKRGHHAAPRAVRDIAKYAAGAILGGVGTMVFLCSPLAENLLERLA